MGRNQQWVLLMEEYFHELQKRKKILPPVGSWPESESWCSHCSTVHCAAVETAIWKDSGEVGSGIPLWVGYNHRFYHYHYHLFSSTDVFLRSLYLEGWIPSCGDFPHTFVQSMSNSIIITWKKMLIIWKIRHSRLPKITKNLLKLPCHNRLHIKTAWKNILLVFKGARHVLRSWRDAWIVFGTHIILNYQN